MYSLGNSVSATLSAREDESAIHGGTDWEVFEWAHFNMFISTSYSSITSSHKRRNPMDNID